MKKTNPEIIKTIKEYNDSLKGAITYDTLKVKLRLVLLEKGFDSKEIEEHIDYILYGI